MPALQNPRHERYAQLIVEALNSGQPKPYCATHAYIAAGYRAKDPGKPGSAQGASSRLLYRVIGRVREIQQIAAQNPAESVEKIARKLNEIQQEARADKAHAAAVAAVLGKAKILNIGEQQSHNPQDYKAARSMQDIGRKLLQAVGFASPDDASIQAAIEANDAFVTSSRRSVSMRRGLR
jgi:hypothetical protein